MRELWRQLDREFHRDYRGLWLVGVATAFAVWAERCIG